MRERGRAVERGWGKGMDGEGEKVVGMDGTIYSSSVSANC